jgi:hypothetical protein
MFINETGEIAVSGRVSNGDDHAFLLVPVDDRSENPFDATQVGPDLDEPLAPVLHEPVSPEAVAKFAARSAHRTHIIGRQATQIAQIELPERCMDEAAGKTALRHGTEQYPVAELQEAPPAVKKELEHLSWWQQLTRPVSPIACGSARSKSGQRGS